MKRRIFSILAAFVLVLAVGSVARADTVTQDGIGYTLTYVEADSSTVFDVLLTIDTTNSTFTGNLYSWAVQFTGATLVTIESATLGFSQPIPGQTSANGCGGTPANFWCSQDASGVPTGTSYSWLLDVTMPLNTALPTDSHIQAFYCLNPDNQGNCNGFSQDVSVQTPVPEPGTLALFGTGLLSVAGFLRRKIHA